MKLIRMHVDNFGALHQYDFEFDEGLNIILHDNGWGKTTMAAFLKAMLYGFDSKRSKDITENERKRYYPWQGGKYGGSLDFDAEGVKYRITRTFGETPRSDQAKIQNLTQGTSAAIDPEKIGETLFSLDVNAFQRSVFINQNGLSLEGASSSIHTRLNSLVSQANDVAAFDGAVDDLTKQIKEYEKRGSAGKIADITREITKLEQLRDQQEREIDEQDSDRQRILQLDSLLHSLDEQLTEKKKRLDEISGDVKKREASRKVLKDLEGQISELQGKMNAVARDLGDAVPQKEELDRIKQQKTAADDLQVKLAGLEEEYNNVSAEYVALSAKYNGELPSEEQLNNLQNLYSDYQAVSADGEELTSGEAIPEGYSLIASACENVPSYLDLLAAAIMEETDLQRLVREKENQEQKLQQEATTWQGKKAQLSTLQEEYARTRKELDEILDANPETVKPVIQKLEQLQTLQQLITVKQEDLEKGSLSAEEKTLLDEAPPDLPDREEGRKVLEVLRKMESGEADSRNLKTRLEGEVSKEEALNTALLQYRDVPDQEPSLSQPLKKSSGSAMIALGAVAAAAGAVLGFLVNPLFAAFAAIGVVLIVLGITGNSRYKEQQRSYENELAALQKDREARKKKNEVLKDLQDVRASIADLQEQIRKQNLENEKNRNEVKAWLHTYGADDTRISADEITRVLDSAEKTETIRSKAEDIKEKESFLAGKKAEFERGFSDVLISCPKLACLDVNQAMESLRAAGTLYHVKAENLKRAESEYSKFLKLSGLSETQFAAEESPEQQSIKRVLEDTKVSLQDAIWKINSAFSLIGLKITETDFHPVFRKAEQFLNDYQNHVGRLQEQKERNLSARKKKEQLQTALTQALSVIRGIEEEQPVPDRIAVARKDLGTAARLKGRLEDAGASKTDAETRFKEAQSTVSAFLDRYLHFLPESPDPFNEICEKVEAYEKGAAAVQPLITQCNTIRQENGGEIESAEETDLKSEIQSLETRRDNFLIESTQKIEAIRRADSALDMYPDVVQEIRSLYEQKQKAQNTLLLLKRTIQLLNQAKENLANRYLHKVEELFNSYMKIWLNNDAVRGILDLDFNITIEENDKEHVAQGYSTGYCDLIDFCMRLALIDTLFEKEQPFLILDDPFVNLDNDRLLKALELLNALAATKQIIYFVCHPIRAVDAKGDSDSHNKFMRLAAETKQTLELQKPLRNQNTVAKRKTPKEMYHVEAAGGPLAIQPAKPNYTITNSIFSMAFLPADTANRKDHSYELFFIDAPGRVLNDRQLIEVKNGKLSTDRIQFSLNTRDDSGDQYELMIQESGQDDYAVVARIPFRARMAFAGTFSFD